MLVKSFARIHKSNLINAGILPLTFVNADDYDKIAQGDELVIKDVKAKLENGEPIVVTDVTRGIDIPVDCELTDRTKAIIIAGGLLDYTRENS